MTLIKVDQACKSFKLGEVTVQALRSVSFDIETGGGIVALMGPSGSGKSTLLNLIGALDSATSGTIEVKSKVLSKLTDDQRAEFRNETVGFVFQNFNLIPVLTTIENVILPSQISFNPKNDSYLERGRELLKKVGLESQIDQSVNRLSGGQMQRVSIARALVNRPDIVLADEPTANLDHKTSDTVLEVMRELCVSEGVTVVMATHDHSVLRFCDRIITLRDGQLVSDELQRKA